MKIAILIVDISLLGGVEVVTINLAEKLKKENKIVEIICCRNKYQYKNKDIQVHNLDISEKNKYFSNVYLKKLKYLLAEGKFDKLIIQLNSFTKACILANPRLINELSKAINLLIVVHNSPKSFLMRYRLYKESLAVFGLKKMYTIIKYRREALNFAKKIRTDNLQLITLSEGCRRELWKYYGMDSTVIYNAYEPYLYNSHMDKQDEIIWVGRLAREKNIAFLIDAWKGITHLGWSLRIIGSGPEERSLQAYVKEMEVEDVVFEGQISHDKVIERMKIAKILAVTSFHEGFPTIVTEAMNAKMVVVSTKYDGFSDELLNKKTSIVTSNSIFEYRQALEMLMSNNKLLEEMGNNAYQVCLEFYNKDAAKKRY